MKKKKQSKKRWAWTEAQKRKNRTNQKYHYHGGGVPRWFCRILDNEDKRRCQRALRELKCGLDPEDFVFNPKYNGSSAKWLWV
jgi:hypothetical protein|tara:strand:- start:1509 stop:1757 length:249 start_codon:yes stop_codon:yes gene_type:complete